MKKSDFITIGHCFFMLILLLWFVTGASAVVSTDPNNWSAEIYLGTCLLTIYIYKKIFNKKIKKIFNAIERAGDKFDEDIETITNFFETKNK